MKRTSSNTSSSNSTPTKRKSKKRRHITTKKYIIFVTFVGVILYLTLYFPFHDVNDTMKAKYEFENKVDVTIKKNKVDVTIKENKVDVTIKENKDPDTISLNVPLNRSLFSPSSPAECIYLNHHKPPCGDGHRQVTVDGQTSTCGQYNIMFTNRHKKHGLNTAQDDNIHNTDNDILEQGRRLIATFLFHRDLKVAFKVLKKNVGSLISSNNFSTSEQEFKDDGGAPDVGRQPSYLLFRADRIPSLMRRIRWLINRGLLTRPVSSKNESLLYFQIVPDDMRREAAIPSSMLSNSSALREHFITYRRPCDTNKRKNEEKKYNRVFRGIFDTCVVWLPVNRSTHNNVMGVSANTGDAASSSYHYVMEPVSHYRDLRSRVIPNCFTLEQTIGQEDVEASWDELEANHYNTGAADNDKNIVVFSTYNSNVYDAAQKKEEENGDYSMGVSAPSLPNGSQRKNSIITADKLRIVLFGPIPAHVVKKVKMPSISPIISKDYFCRCDDTNIEKKGEKESSYGFIGLQFHHIWRDVYGTGALVKQSLDRKDLTKIERDWNHMVTECSKQRSPSQPADVNVNFLLGCMEERIITLLNRLNKHHPPLPAVYLVPRPAPIVGKSASEIMKTHASSSYLRSYPQPQPLVRTAMCNDNTPLGTTLSHPSLYEFNRAGTSAGRGSAAAGSNSLRKNNEESHQDIQISTVAEIVRPNDENRLFSLYPPLFGHIQAVEERQSPRGLQTTIIPTVQFRALQQDEDVFHYCATVVRKPISDDTFSSSSDSGGGEGSKLNTSTSSKGPKIASIQTLKLFSFLSGVPLVCYEDADIVCDTIDGNGIFEGNLINYVKSVLGNARNEVRLAATILKERELSDVGKTIPSAGSEQDLLKLLQEAFVLGGVIKDEGRNNNSDISSTPAIPPVVLWTPAFVDGLLQGIRRRIDRLNKEIDEHERDNANGQGAQSVPSLADRPPPLLGVSQATANWLYTGGSKSRLQPNDGTLARAWVSSNLSMTDFENGGNMLNSLWGLPSLVRKPFEKTIEDVLQLMPDGQPRSLRAQLPIDVIPSGLMNNTNLRKGADVTITDDNVLEVPFSKFTKREIGNDVPFARSRLSPLIPSKDVHVSSWAPLEAIVKLVPDSNNEGTHTDDITAKKKRDIMIHNKKGLVASLGQSMEFVRSHISPMVRFYQRHGKELQSDMEASGISSTQFPEVLDRRVDVEFLSEHSVPLFEAVKTYGEYFLQKNHSRNQDKGTLAERNGVHFPMLKMPTIVSSDVSSTKQNSLSTIRPLFNHYDNDVSLMDIGGNVGLFSYLIRSEMNVNAYMFEALLANVYLLETTGCLNRVREGSAWASAVEAIVTTTSIKAKVIFSDSGSSNAASVTNHEKAALFSSTTLTAVVTFPSSSSSVLLRRLRSIALCNEAPSSNASHWVYHCTPNLRSASIFYGALGKEKPNPGKKGTLCVIMANEGNVGDTFVTCNPEDVAKAHILIARLKELDLTVSNPSAFKHFSSSEFIWGSLLPFGFLTVNRLDSIVMNDTMWALDAPSPSDPTARNFPRIFDDGNVHDAGVLSHENNTNNVTTNKESNVSSTSSGREGNTSTSVIGRLGLHPILLKRALKVIFDFDVTDEEYQYISIPLSQSQVPATSRRISAALSHLHPQFVKRFEKLIKQEYAKMLPHKVKRDEEGQERGKRETEGDGVLFPQFKAYPSAVSVIYVNRLQSTRDLLRYVCIRQYSFKMDVENFEPFIIQGASNFLKEPLFRPISFVSEIRMSSETVAMAKKMVQRPSSSKTKGKRGNATSNENHESEEAYDYVGFYLDQPVLLRNERDVEEKVSTDGLRGVSNMLWVRRGLEYLIFPMLPPIYHWN